MFDKLWRPSNIRSTTEIISFVLVLDGRCFVRLDSRVSNMFDARMRTTLAQRHVSIVSSVFHQTCFNRLATHFNISMFGHQTMFDGVWSPNIYRLSRPLHIDQKLKLIVLVFDGAMFFSLGQPRIKHVWCAHSSHACSAACINCFICVWWNMFYSL